MGASLLAVLVVSVLLAAVARRHDVSAPLAVGLPLATTFAVGFVAYKTVPELAVAAALTLGAIVAPPDAVSDHDAARRREPAE